jgi:trimeric autotransporter adhesin
VKKPTGALRAKFCIIFETKYLRLMYRKGLFFLLLSAIALKSTAQVREITTIAGSSFIGGFGGDGGLGDSCLFDGPNDVSADLFGNVYIEDYFNFRIRRVNSLGYVSTFAGTGFASYSGDGGMAPAAAMKPNGVTTDRRGNVYISDNSVNAVRKVDAVSGIITLYAGWPYHQGNAGDSGLAANVATMWGPRGMCTDSKGNLYIADVNNHVIRKVDSMGYIYKFAGNYGCPFYAGDNGYAVNACLDSPMAVAADKWDNIYIADYKNNVIRKVDTNGVITTVAGNNFYSGYGGDGGPATAGKLNGPRGVAVDKYGFLYISDAYNNRIRMVDTFGNLSTIAGNGTPGFGGDGGGAAGGSLFFPQGISVDTFGSIYVADADNERVRKIYWSTTGVAQTQATSVNVFPNPATGTIRVTGLTEGETAVMQNLLGQTVSETLKHDGNLDLGNQPSGIYLLRVTSNSGKVATTIRVTKI